MGAIAIYNSGLVTGVGMSAPASCAAIRAGITGFVETRFHFGGEWLQGCPVPLVDSWRGADKLRHMVTTAIEECLAENKDNLSDYPLLLCVAEQDRPGRFADLDDGLLSAVATDLGQTLHPDSRLYTTGRIGGVQALDHARQMIAAGAPACVIAGVDTYLVAETLTALNNGNRLATAENSNGFIPGEAAAAVLVGPVKRRQEPQLLCIGVGFGVEPAPLGSGEPLRAEGLVTAIRAAFGDGRCDYTDLDFRLTDNSGEAYGFKEGALALGRTLRNRKKELDIWHPGDCLGEVGAAMAPILMAVMMAATTKGYAPGPAALCQVSGDGAERAAWILRRQHPTREGI